MMVTVVTSELQIDNAKQEYDDNFDERNEC